MLSTNLGLKSLEKLIKGQKRPKKAKKGQKRPNMPAKAIKGQNFKNLSFYHFSMENHPLIGMKNKKKLFFKGWNFSFSIHKIIESHFVKKVKISEKFW